MANTSASSTVGKQILAFAVIALLVAGFVWIIFPFIPTLVWSAIVVSTTWPIFWFLRQKCGGRDGLASAVMVILIALTFLLVVVPLFANISQEAAEAARRLSALDVSQSTIEPLLLNLPAFVAEPIRDLLNSSPAAVREQAHQFVLSYSGSAVQIVGALAKGVAQGLLQFLLVLLTAFFLYRSGASIGADVRRAAERLGGARFLELLRAVQGTVKGAVLGLIMTAIAQGLLAGISFAIAGAPVPVLLGFATAVFSFIPFGAPLVYLPTVGIVAATHGLTWALPLLAFCVVVISNADNVIRPLFISQATSLPILLVFFATIGGLLSFGLLGLFVGPALAAIAVTLWREFVR